MKTETKHTELPWSVSQERGSYFVKGERALVAGLYNHENSPLWAVAQEANAEFIVRACNSHEELLDALQDAADYMGEMGHPVEVLRRARAAIAKAEGQ